MLSPSHILSSLRVSEVLVTLKNGSIFVDILQFDLEFGILLNLQFGENVKMSVI